MLGPIWVEKAETTKKIRQRLRRVVKWVKAHDHFRGSDAVKIAEKSLPKLKVSGACFRAVSYVELPSTIKKL